MNEHLENRCMSLRDESLQINCSIIGADDALSEGTEYGS